jgi:hypothetical protein
VIKRDKRARTRRYDKVSKKQEIDRATVIEKNRRVIIVLTLMTMTIIRIDADQAIIIYDIHIGYEKSNVKSFTKFLDNLI